MTRISNETLITGMVVCALGIFLILGSWFIGPEITQDVDGRWSGFTEEEIEKDWKADCEKFHVSEVEFKVNMDDRLALGYDSDLGLTDMWICLSCKSCWKVESLSFVYSCPFCYSGDVHKIDR